MLIQFHRTSFKSFTRHYARAAVNAWLKRRAIIKDEATRHKKGTPLIKCKKKMYDFYEDDAVTKKIPILASHGWKNRKSKGDYFFIYPYGNDKTNPRAHSYCETFKNLNINDSLIDNLKSLDISKPLEIQKLAIPTIFKGYNVLVAAETGCGKTLAYLLPMITKILMWKQYTQNGINSPLGLIITPSRELTVQIALMLIKLSNNLGIKTKIVTGGRTKRMVSNPPVGYVDVLVCSFGVISKLSTFGIYKLKFLKFVVLDEADSLFHHSFKEKLQVFMRRIPIGYSDENIENTVPATAQLVLASATIPSQLQNVLGDIVNLNSLEHVTTNKLHKILVPQKFVRLIPSQKPLELLKYVKPKSSKNQHVIVFSNRNATSYWVSLFLHKCGIKVTNLNGDMPFHIRQGKYGEFLNGKTTVLSTTDAGSRGLDTLMVNHILNYDFPLDTSVYIHRCGRTGRVGTVGDSRVTNFISKPGEVVVVQKIEMAARRMKPIPLINLVESNYAEGEEEEYTEEIIENLNEAENIPY